MRIGIDTTRRRAITWRPLSRDGRVTGSIGIEMNPDATIRAVQPSLIAAE
jgi:hypothetical protein